MKVPPKTGRHLEAEHVPPRTSPEGKPPQASAWSPPLVGDFHALDKFGEIVFADEKGQVPATPAAAPGKAAVNPHAAMREAITSGMSGAVPGETPAVDMKKKAAAIRKRKVANER